MSLSGSPLADVAHESSRPAPGRGEAVVAWAFIVAAFLLRVPYVFHYSIDSDEPQHLHVAWGWAHGYVQYRDLFDNHTPLFHMLCAPVVALLGDRPDLLVLMRFVMLPIAALTVFAVYSMGKSLFSKRVGLWSAALVALFPFFLRMSVEFRTDQLWAACWLIAVAILVKPPLTRRRAFAAGLMFGTAAAVSMKTSFFLVGLVAAVLLAVLVSRKAFNWRERARSLLLAGAAAAGGLVIVPLAVVIFFLAEGAIREFGYGVFGHNLMPGIYQLDWFCPLLFAGAAAIGLAGAVIALRKTPAPGLAVRRMFLCLLVGALFAVLALWPVVTKQDMLPIYPLLIVAAVAGGDGLLQWLAGRWRAAGARLSTYPIAVSLALLEIVLILVGLSAKNDTPFLEKRWSEVLALTDPGQPVMDLKGELIFRPRGYYYVLEKVTKARLQTGLLRDDVAEQLVKAKVCVSSTDYINGLPKASAFLKRNYVSVGTLRVAGKFLDADAADPTKPIQFELKIPARYTIITPSGAGRGLLDGAGIRGSRVLDAGVHEYRPAAGETKPVVVWAQAVDRGFSPFLVPRSERSP